MLTFLADEGIQIPLKGAIIGPQKWPYGTFPFKPAEFTDTILRIYPIIYLYKSHRVLYRIEWEKYIKSDNKHVSSVTTIFYKLYA